MYDSKNDDAYGLKGKYTKLRFLFAFKLRTIINLK
jgi:hypothetical protein